MKVFVCVYGHKPLYHVSISKVTPEALSQLGLTGAHPEVIIL